MIHTDLFRHVLLAPANDLPGGRLKIVSGFATANMADRHMDYLKQLDIGISIELIIGMTIQQGIQEAQHSAFCKLVNQAPWGIDFQCRYVVKGNPVHAKSYVWLDNQGRPAEAFCGSANYTMVGFGRSQVESMSAADPQDASQFHDHILRYASDCTQPHIEDLVVLLTGTSSPGEERERELESVTLSLLDNKNKRDTPRRSGINWGQRPEYNRDPNQAYIHIPARIQKSGFFPDRGEQFTVLTDDGDSFICVRAQDGGKGLQTTQDNSLLGAYLRARMMVGSGEYVTRHHLVEYGRADVTFTKIDPETYLLDFRPNYGPGDDAEIWPEK